MKKTTYDYTALEERIRVKFGNKARFCEMTGVSNSLLSQKLKQGVAFTQKDISQYSMWLSIPKSQIGKFFFTEKE